MHQVLGREIPFAEAAVRIGDNLAIGVNANASRHPAELLHSISRQGSSVVMTTHNLHLLKEYPGKVYRCKDHHLTDVTDEYVVKENIEN